MSKGSPKRMIIGQSLLIGTILGTVYFLKEVLGYRDVLIPPFSALPEYLYAQIGALVGAAAVTYLTAFLALTVTVLLSFAVGIALSWSPRLIDIALAWALAWQTFPVVAIAPLLYIFLGDGFVTILFIAISVAYFPLCLVVLSAVATSQPRVESFYRQTGRWPVGGRLAVRLAGSREAIGNALLGSAALALVGAVIAEFLFGNNGIGNVIRHAQYNRSLITIMSCLIVIAITNMIYFFVLQVIVEWFLHRKSMERAS